MPAFQKVIAFIQEREAAFFVNKYFEPATHFNVGIKENIFQRGHVLKIFQ